jgi:hypothetical protein
MKPMKKTILIFTFLLISNLLAAQKYTEQDLVGKWKVVAIVKENDNPNMKDLLKSFGAAVFEFKENLDFKLTTSIPNKLFKMVIDMTNKSKWKLNNNKFSISIGSKADGYSIMKIMVFEVDGKTIFHLSETEMDLVVEKEI